MTINQTSFFSMVLWIPFACGCDNSSPAASQTGTVSLDESKQDSKLTAADNPPAIDTIADKSFDDIKFEMEKSDTFDRSMLTPKIEELFGRRIRIRGYMFPTLKKRGLTEFVLVRDNLECCFGPGAALYDCIYVHMNEGTTAEYSIRPIAVEGRFTLDEFIGPDGNHLAIYRLDAEVAE